MSRGASTDSGGTSVSWPHDKRERERIEFEAFLRDYGRSDLKPILHDNNPDFEVLDGAEEGSESNSLQHTHPIARCLTITSNPPARSPPHMQRAVTGRSISLA